MDEVFEGLLNVICFESNEWQAKYGATNPPTHVILPPHLASGWTMLYGLKVLVGYPAFQLLRLEDKEQG